MVTVGLLLLCCSIAAGTEVESEVIQKPVFEDGNGAYGVCDHDGMN